MTLICLLFRLFLYLSCTAKSNSYDESCVRSSRISIHFLENIGWVETRLSAKGCYLNTAPAPLDRLASEIKQLEKINTSRYLNLDVVQESLGHLSHVIPAREKAFPKAKLQTSHVVV